MRLLSYQLCRWCDAALHGRRKWGWLAANLLLLALSLAAGWLNTLLPPLLLANCTLLLYQLHRHHAFGTAYQRQPRPTDAQCETVLIDATLLGQGTRLRAAAQPIDVADGLSLRLGSGALLLGTAMVMTAEALPAADRAAVLSAVRELNLKPERMRSQYPVLAREAQEEVQIVTVRDGMNERRYYQGSAAALSHLCPAIWEGHTRPLTDRDLARITDTARYIAQGNCRVLAYATALAGEEPVFLGLCGVGEEVDLAAMAEVSSLRAMGLTILLDPAGQPDSDLESLRALLELPDHHARADLHLTTSVTASGALGITRLPGESLTEPIITLRQRFRTIEDTLRRFCVLLGLPLLIALLMGRWHAALLSAILLSFAAIALGVDLTRPLPRKQTLLILLATSLIAKAILLTQPAALAQAAGSILTLCTALCAVLRLCGPAFRWKGLPLLLPIAAAAYVLLTVLTTLEAALLLPLGFALLISGVLGVFLLLEAQIFR
ncbi:MAG: hypothetical protein IJB81_11770 [Clostridia bacterium]|nr:hypothetical protein [Clostridia bacterium]